jgi:hypothetical protein
MQGNLNEDQYITVDHNGIDIDWVWASNYNVQFFIEDNVTNELFAPELFGWRNATDSEFAYFKLNVTYDKFEIGDSKTYKHAIDVFNDNSSGVHRPATEEFLDGDISGEFRKDTTYDEEEGLEPEDHWFETFYVRNSLQASGPTPIPEPWSLLLFITGLFAIQRKLRIKAV